MTEPERDTARAPELSRTERLRRQDVASQLVLELAAQRPERRNREQLDAMFRELRSDRTNRSVYVFASRLGYSSMIVRDVEWMKRCPRPSGPLVASTT